MRQALEMALEAFEEIAWSNSTDWQRDRAKVAITAIKEALAQPEPEPVKIIEYICVCGKGMRFESKDGIVAPQRTWVGLTDLEIGTIAYNVNPLDGIRQFSRAIEAKLKEKNT